jgi:hypothetical protein
MDEIIAACAYDNDSKGISGIWLKVDQLVLDYR